MSADQFREFAAGLGYDLPHNIAPGSRFRFSVNGKRANDAGWGFFFSDGEGGVVGDWRTGARHVWQAKRERKLSASEYRELQARIERERREAQAEREREAQDAADKAGAIWESLRPAPGDHEYLSRKGIKPHALRIYTGPKLTIRSMDCDGALVMALRNAAGEIRSLEFIAPNGEKRFLPGGIYRACYCSVGGAPSEGEPLCIAEGFATAASIHEATGYSVAVAATAGNLEPVAVALRAKPRYAQTRIIVAADDDAATQGNPGIAKATEAARAIGGVLATPDFGPERPNGATDFNDLAALRGVDAVRKAIVKAQGSELTEIGATRPV